MPPHTGGVSEVPHLAVKGHQRPEGWVSTFQATREKYFIRLENKLFLTNLLSSSNLRPRVLANK